MSDTREPSDVLRQYSIPDQETKRWTYLRKQGNKIIFKFILPSFFLPFNHQKNGAYITYLFLINETIETYNLNKVKEFTVLKDRDIANMTISLTIYLMRQKN